MSVKRRFSTRWGHPYHLQGACTECRQTLLHPLCSITPMTLESYTEYSAQSKREDTPEEHDRMPPKGLGVRSCSDWCPEPVTELDLDTCRHHELSLASPREVEHARQPLSLRVSRQSLGCMEVQDGCGVYAVRGLGCP